MTAFRECARRGCTLHVKKPTGKYCSVRCCSVDPERHERLRLQARRTSRRTVIPMARQLSFDPQVWTSDPEAQIAELCQDREDVPNGMSRYGG